MGEEEFKNNFKDKNGIVFENHRSSEQSIRNFMKVLVDTETCSKDAEVIFLDNGVVAIHASNFKTGDFFRLVSGNMILSRLGVRFDTIYSYCR